MSSLTCKPAAIRIVAPPAMAEKLTFRVFANAAPIGYARLAKQKSRPRPVNVVDMVDPKGCDAYELKMIEISQNYRKHGVGTSLLQEVIRYCRDTNIRCLTGEIKGDTASLRHWYRNNGFTVSSDDRIELLPTVSC